MGSVDITNDKLGTLCTISYAYLKVMCEKITTGIWDVHMEAKGEENGPLTRKIKFRNKKAGN